MSLPALFPAALALLFAVWCGSFGEGAGWGAAATAYASLLGAALWVGPRWRDPWRLGTAGSLLLVALLAAVALAWWGSPVSRAGRVGLALLPAFLWLPAVVAGAWRGESRRRWGARSVSIAVAVVGGISLALWLSGATARPALPVGQHLHLTVWLALLLPLAVVPWREGGVWRWLAVASGALAVAAILGGRTLAGGLVLVVEAGLALAWYGAQAEVGFGRAGRGSPTAERRVRIVASLAGLFAAAVAALLWDDLLALVRGTDPSASARQVYAAAGWAGVGERPVLGLGPGSTAWTLAAFLRPVPGVNPPSEVVGELHLLPLAVAYELGLPGLLLAAATAVLFGWRRLRERLAARDPDLLAAGLLGLAGGAVTGLATADWRVTALPVAAAVAAGAALAGGAEPGAGREERRVGARARRFGWLVEVLYVVVAAAAVGPLVLAHRAYDRAVESPRDEALRLLDRAVDLDPRFPLYRARRGWLAAESPENGRAGLEDSLAAARGALGVGPLWLAAGAAAESAAESAVAAFAYERACSLDPLGAMPPFRLARIGSPMHDPVAVAARSLAADPRLAAATAWRGREELLDRAVSHLTATSGLDPGWRTELVERVPAAIGAGTGPEASAELALVLDATPDTSASLHLFRRRPWRARLAPVPADAEAAAELAGLPPATTLSTTDPLLFPPTCTGPFVPQRLRRTLWKSW